MYKRQAPRAAQQLPEVSVVSVAEDVQPLAAAAAAAPRGEAAAVDEARVVEGVGEDVNGAGAGERRDGREVRGETCMPCEIG